MMALADPHVGAAAAASPVAGPERVHLGLGGHPLGVSVPQRHALGAEHHPPDRRVAEMLLQHALGDHTTTGYLRERLGAVRTEMLHDGDVRRRPTTTPALAAATGAAFI